jgi:predicted transcriptional regulator
MPRFQELRLQARLSVNRLARLADVDYKTAQRADEGLPIQQLKAIALVEALSRELGRPIRLDDIEDLNIS